MKKMITKTMALIMAGMMALSPVGTLNVKAETTENGEDTTKDVEISAGTEKDTAARIELGKSYVSSLVAKQSAWFVVTTPDKKAYYNLYVKEFNLLGSSERFPSMAVYNEFGERVAYGKNPYNPLNTTINFVLEPNTTYHITVYDNICDSNFRLIMDYKEDEIGDTKDTAKKISLNKTITSSIDGTDDPDFFSFVAGGYEKYHLVGKNLSINGSLKYQVFSKYDEVLATGNATAGQSLDLALPQLEKGETYYAKAICSSIGNYQIKIEPVRTSLKDAGAVVSVKSKVKYTGKALTPSVTVKVNNKKLKKGVDYKVAYSNNKKVGKATVTITGIGNYKGTIKKTFKIVK